LVVPLAPPLGRVLVLAKADATLRADAQDYPLFTNRWASGALAPAGHLLLESFELDGTVPVWRFRCGGRLVEHRIWMEAGADTVHAAWRLDGGPNAAPAELRVTLLANARDHHGETWPAGFVPEVAAGAAALTVAVDRFTLCRE
jgi:4-alpha-glucanotransferase